MVERGCRSWQRMTVDQTWKHLLELLERMSAARGGSFTREDQALAAEVSVDPGGVGERILAGTDELAGHGCVDPSFPSLLGYFWNLCPPGDPFAAQHPEIFRGLPATFAAMDATRMLRAYAAARRRWPRLGAIAQNNSARIACYFLNRAGLAALDELTLPAEHRDVLRAQVQGGPLPDVLPVDVTSWSPQQIAGTLADYAGTSIAELEARLRPGGCSSSGFLAPGESLGQLIHCDAVALARIGVMRHDLADRIDRAIQGAGVRWPRTWTRANRGITANSSSTTGRARYERMGSSSCRSCAS